MIEGYTATQHKYRNVVMELLTIDDATRHIWRKTNKEIFK